MSSTSLRPYRRFNSEQFSWFVDYVRLPQSTGSRFWGLRREQACFAVERTPTLCPQKQTHAPDCLLTASVI